MVHPDQESFSIQAGVDFDSRKDVVVPIVITLANKTEGWDLKTAEVHTGYTQTDLTAKTQLDIMWSHSSKNDHLQFPNTKQTNPGGKFTKPSKPLGPGKSLKARALVVVHGYYSPGNPNGDPRMLDALGLSVYPVFDMEGDRTAFEDGDEHDNPGLKLSGEPF